MRLRLLLADDGSVSIPSAIRSESAESQRVPAARCETCLTSSMELHRVAGIARRAVAAAFVPVYSHAAENVWKVHPCSGSSQPNEAVRRQT